MINSKNAMYVAGSASDRMLGKVSSSMFEGSAGLKEAFQAAKDFFELVESCMVYTDSGKEAPVKEKDAYSLAMNALQKTDKNLDKKEALMCLGAIYQTTLNLQSGGVIYEHVKSLKLVNAFFNNLRDALIARELN